jgi:hypothetical protein
MKWQARLMQKSHIIHDDIALHKSQSPAYIRNQEDGTRSAKAIGAVSGKASRFRSEVDKVSGPKGSHHRIRSGALLLPAPLRSDGQHSSSQLPITINDARWISSPSGRYSFHNINKFQQLD